MAEQEGRYGASVQAAALFALGLSARWMYVQQTADHPLRDVALGTAIGFVERAGAADATEFTLLYDAFVAGVFALGGHDYGLVRGVQVVLGAGNCVLAWLLARAVFSPRVAAAVGLAAALYGPSIYFAGELLPPVLATTLVLLSLITLSRALSAAQAQRFWLPGLLLGMAVLAEWWVSLFALASVVWLLRRQNRGAGAAAYLALGICALLLPALLWTAWTPGAMELGLGESFGRVYALWQGSEFLTELNPYYARQHSIVLTGLLWKAGLAFPFGLVAPLAVIGLGARLRAEREPEENVLLLFVGCFAAQALLFPVDSASRVIAVPALLLFAAVGVQALLALPLRQALAVGSACLILVVGLNIGQVEAAGRARQHHWLGHGFEQLGLRVNATREYETALALDAGNRDSYYELADHYRANGDNIRCRGLYERLLQRWPDQDRARRMLAEQYMAAGRAPEAVVLYRELMGGKTDSAAVDVLTGLGEALISSGDLEGGFRAYREMLEIQPGNSALRKKLALLYLAAGQLPQAVAAYRFLFDDGLVVQVGPHLAEALIRSQREEEAVRVLEQVLQVEPESPAALALLGKQLFEQGRHREAAGHFERLRMLWPEDYRVYFFLTKIYHHLGEQAKGDVTYELYSRYRRLKDRAEIKENMELMGDMVLGNLQSELESR